MNRMEQTEIRKARIHLASVANDIRALCPRTKDEEAQCEGCLAKLKLETGKSDCFMDRLYNLEGLLGYAEGEVARIDDYWAK
jgi:hypothetical protein